MADINTIFRALVERFTHYTRFYKLTVCEVVRQSEDLLSVDLRPETSDIAPMADVPIRLGVPGIKAKIAIGQSMLLGFENGDPRRPFAIAHGSKTVCEELVLDASVRVSVDAPSVELSKESSPVARLGDSISLIVMIGSVPTPCVGTIVGVSQSKVKA